MKILSIIIPVFNEEKTIAPLLSKVLKQSLNAWKKEIIVVDDGSSDRTFQKIRPFLSSIQLLTHNKNLGKGAAIRTALLHAKGDAILFQDADLEYDPSDWIFLIKELEKAKVDTVYGSRNLRPSRRGYFPYFLGGVLLSKLTNLLYKSNLTDICTGYKLFWKRTLSLLTIERDDFSFDVEITVKLLKSGRKIVEVPISYNPRKFSQGKKISFIDGLKDIMLLTRYKFGRESALMENSRPLSKIKAKYS